MPGPGEAEYATDEQLEKLFHEHIDLEDMEGPRGIGRLVFREVFKRWLQARKQLRDAGGPAS